MTKTTYVPRKHKFGTSTPTEPRRSPKQDILKRGIEVQTWGLDANKELLTAGVHWVDEINTQTKQVKYIQISLS